MGRAHPMDPSRLGVAGSYQALKILRKIHWVQRTKSSSVVANERRLSWESPSMSNWWRMFAMLASVVMRGC